MNSFEGSEKIRSILVIDDDEMFRLLLKTFLFKLLPNADIVFYDPVAKGMPGDDFAWGNHDLLLLDYDLGPGQNGLDWFRRYKDVENFPATIMLTAKGDEELAVEVMRYGAQDYINKTKLSMERLEQSIKSAESRRAHRDALSKTLNFRSNIFNKVHFYKRIQGVIDGRNPGASCLLHLHIDKYDEILDQHGLLATDDYITQLTDAIVKMIAARKIEFNMVRAGDATLNCLLRDCKGTEAGSAIAAEIRKVAAATTVAVGGGKIESTISIGLVPVSSADTVDTLIARADETCRGAAAQGGIAVMELTADKPVLPAKTRRQEGEAAPPPRRDVDLADIIKRNNIQPYYQPYIPLSEAATTFAAHYFNMRLKLLVGNGQEIDAQAMSELRLTSGNPAMLDLWATRHLLSQLLKIRKDPDMKNHGFFVRLFAQSLSNDKLFKWMESLIRKADVLNIASTLVFEIWPPDFLGNKKQALKIMNQMRETWGVSFAIFDVINEDVLTTCVKQASFEFIKFIMDQEKFDTITAMGEKARELGALTVLENISTAEDLSKALEAGFDYGQGDFIQPPIDQLVSSNVINL